MVASIVSDKLDAIARLALKHGVTRLWVFGSALSDHFDLGRSDLDFLVEFAPGTPSDRADRYFGLLEDLQSLFDLPIDLIELGPIRNPYFREEIEKTRYPLYEAA